MPRRNFMIPDELDTAFRKAVHHHYGDNFGHGSYSHAIQEAIRLWIQNSTSTNTARK